VALIIGENYEGSSPRDGGIYASRHECLRMASTFDSINVHSRWFQSDDIQPKGNTLACRLVLTLHHHHVICS
jgi:hypothetical protein